MLRNPEFDSKEVDPDLHKRLEKAVEMGGSSASTCERDQLMGIKI
jgi:hypothetical protein